MEQHNSIPNYFNSEIKPRRRAPFRFRLLPQGKPHINLILFLLTVLSTYLTSGIWYSVAIIAILLSHEMGHYVMCRKYGVTATLPFFIPFPYLNPFGTMGAVIQMRGMIPNRKALFDIGVAGPLAGFVLTVPAIYFGVAHSTIIDSSQIESASLSLGESLLFKFISFLAVGRVPEGHDILLHPAAYAGWAGLFVTALNLLPIGQLDGGHLVYSLLGRQRAKIYYIIFLIGLGLLSIIYPGWALLFGLLLVFGRRHPPPLDDVTPLDNKRKIIGFLVILIFMLSFTPIPFKL